MVTLYVVILIFLYAVLCLNARRRAQKLWDWACRDWHPYHDFLLPEEIQYIQYCIRSTFWDYLLRPFTGILWPHLPGLSSFTYGVQLEEETDNEMCDRSRCGFGIPCGELLGGQQLETLARAVFQARGLPETTQLYENENQNQNQNQKGQPIGHLYGLAWHGTHKTLRVYWKVPIQYIKQSVKTKRDWEGNVWDVGLYARTWNWETGECIDEKQYVLEKDFGGTWMHTRSRGWVYQSNFRETEDLENLPTVLTREIKKWTQQTGLSLDTVSHWGNTWVLYFPRVSLFWFW
jgi:hypothetical protein